MALKRTVPLFLVAVVAVALTTLQGADAATFPTVCTCHDDPIRTNISCTKGISDDNSCAIANNTQYLPFITRYVNMGGSKICAN
ncbi:hypothetical protein BG000_007090 [Podila horticola]|nr:hypothetical protein BG000_007090 [Podila horticola]